MTTTSHEASQEPVFSIQRVYLKDCSLETPTSPDIFRKDWHPNVAFELQVTHQQLSAATHQPGGEEIVEVIVSGSATAKIENEIAFLVEVKQAGIFALKNIPSDQLPILLNVVCPNILFPYFREVISSLTMRASFPQLTLDPINFEALYQQRLLQENGSGTTGAAGGSTTIQ